MRSIRAFISGVMVTGELDSDRREAKRAIDALGRQCSAFAYRNFPRTGVDLVALSDENRIASSNLFVLLVARMLTPQVRHEFHCAEDLGLPRCVFAREGEVRSRQLAGFLADCQCPVIDYGPTSGPLSEVLARYVLSREEQYDEEERVRDHTSDVWRRLVEALNRDPDHVFSLSPRQFEELLAELIHSFGYEVSLTSRTRDQGYDIVAVQSADPIFPSVHLVEAKLWTPPRKVGRPVIQGLYGVGMADNCNGVMVVTPTAFSRDAKQFIDEKRLWQFVRLVDGTTLPEWYKLYLERRRGH